MFPWLFLFSPHYTWPHYRLTFNPALHVDSSHEKLFDSFVKVVEKNTHLATRNEALVAKIGSLQSLFVDTVQLHHANALDEVEVAKLKQRFNALTNDHITQL